MQNNNSYDDFFEQDYRRKISAELQPSNDDKQSLPVDLRQLKFNLKGHMITNNQLPLNDIFQLSLNQNLFKSQKA